MGAHVLIGSWMVIIKEAERHRVFCMNFDVAILVSSDAALLLMVATTPHGGNGCVTYSCETWSWHSLLNRLSCYAF